MTTRNRSISYKLSKASTPARKAEVLHDWANRWYQEHIDIVQRIKDAVDSGNLNDLRINLGELRAVTSKKHDALHNIFNHLLSLKEDDKKQLAFTFQKVQIDTQSKQLQLDIIQHQDVC